MTDREVLLGKVKPSIDRGDRRGREQRGGKNSLLITIIAFFVAGVFVASVCEDRVDQTLWKNT